MILLLNDAAGTVGKVKLALQNIGYTDIMQHEDIEHLPADTGFRAAILCTASTDSKNTLQNCKEAYPDIPVLLIAEGHTGTNLQKAWGYEGICMHADHVNEGYLDQSIDYATDSKHSKKFSATATRQMFDKNPLPVVIYDKQSLQFMYANQAAQQQYGYTLPEFRELKVTDIRPAEDVPELKNVLHNWEDDNFNNFGRWRHKKKDGSVFHVHILAYNIILNHKKVGVVIAEDIEQQIQAEEEKKRLTNALQQHKDLVDNILTSVNELVWSRHASDFTITYMNSAAESIYGCPAEELIGTKGLIENNMVHPEDRHILEAQIERLMREDHAEAKYRITNKKNEVKHLISKAVLTRSITGKPEFVTGTTTDITELQTAQLKLQEKAEELQNVIDSISDIFIVLDGQLNFTYVNKHFEQLFDTTSDDIKGKNYWDIFPEAKGQKFYREYNKVLKTGKPAHFEEYSTTLNRWVAANIYPIKNGISLYFTDITEELELRKQIKQSELHLRSIINNTDDYIWAIDKDMNLTHANDSFFNNIQAITGHTPVLGQTILLESFDADVLEKYKSAYTQALSGQQLSATQQHDTNGRTIFLETRYYPIVDDGKVTGVSCYMRDVTERRNYIRKIEEANKKLTEIAWLQSHKVRSHTATIMGLVEVYNCEQPDAPDNHKAITGIEHAAQELDLAIREINEKTIFGEEHLKNS